MDAESVSPWKVVCLHQVVVLWITSLPPAGYFNDEGSITATEVFADYTPDTGGTVTYESANEFTRLAIPDQYRGWRLCRDELSTDWKFRCSG